MAFEETGSNNSTGFKKADAFLNLELVKADGTRMRLPKGHPLYNDQKLGRSIKNASEAYLAEREAMTEAQRKKVPEQKEYVIIGTWQSAEVDSEDYEL